MSDATRTPAFCAQCRSRCGCTAIVKDGRLETIEPLPDHPSGAKLCPKGKASAELVYHPDRLTQPLRRTAPKGAADPAWEPISWDEALDEIANRMGDIRAKHGAEQTAFSITTPSGTHMSDGIAWVERFVRAYGSPNTIYGTEICNWHKDVASKFTYGWDIGTPDFANTDCVLLWGNNPAATWLARSVEIQKALKRGAKLLVIDPRPTLFARRADCWLRVKPGTDLALALGLAHQMIEMNGFDESFIRDWSNAPLLVRDDTGAFLRERDLMQGGSISVLYAASEDGELHRYDAGTGRWLDDPNGIRLGGRLQAAGHDGDIQCRTAFDVFAEAASHMTPQRVEATTGVPAEAVTQAAQILATASSTAYYAWNGVGQSINATQTDRAISILYAMTGSYGQPGGNVPGGAASFGGVSGQELITDGTRAKTLGLDERPLGPASSGWVTARDVYRAVLETKPYPVRMLFSFGTNLLASQPDTDLAVAALEQLEFHVHADFFLNATANYADIVLPVSTSWEREGLRTGFDSSLDGLRRVQLRPPVVAPIGDARSDIAIAIDLACRLGHRNQFFGGDVDAGHNHVLAPAGLSVGQLRAHPDGVDLETTVPFAPHTRTDGDGLTVGFPTPTKRIEIYAEALLEKGYDPVPQPPLESSVGRTLSDLPLRLSCAKTVVYCHSQHRNLPSLRRLQPDPIVEMCNDVAAERGIADRDWVRVVTAAGSFVARCKIVKDIEPGSVFAQHGWWVFGGENTPYSANAPLAANMNQAIPTGIADPVSASIPLRCTACQLERIEPS